VGEEVYHVIGECCALDAMGEGAGPCVEDMVDDEDIVFDGGSMIAKDEKAKLYA